MVYCKGASTEAGAILSEREMSKCAMQATIPSNKSEMDWEKSGVCQWPTIINKPITSAILFCQATDIVSLVERNERPKISTKVKQKLLNKAKADGSEIILVDGRIAMTTPTKPIQMASHRRQAILSPRKKCEKTAT